LYYDPDAEPVDASFSFPTADDIKNLLPDFIKGYLAPAPKYEKIRNNLTTKSNHPRVKETEIIEAVEYVVPASYDYFAYAFLVGALDKYSTFFNYTSRLNECDTLVRRAE
jgi:hypothetical protein